MAKRQPNRENPPPAIGAQQLLARLAVKILTGKVGNTDEK
jgi:hypothetical protein